MNNFSNNTCDLCGSTRSYVAAKASSERHRTIICKNCGLICASPLISIAALDQIYESFEVTREGLGNSSDALRTDVLRDEENLAHSWGMRIVRRATEIRNKRVLDLRCRTGALSRLLELEGAEVHSVDPFAGNLKYGKEVRGLKNAYQLPFSSLHKLELPCRIKFDLVVSLTDHVLGHVLSPRVLLTRLFEELTPGGYLVFEEKDVLQPAHWYKKSVLDSGKAHLYHLTVDTTTRYVRSAGFEIQECTVDRERLSNYRHMWLVARKPDHAPTSYHFALADATGPTPESIRDRLRKMERAAQIDNLRQLGQTTRRALTQVPGARSVWRFFRGICSSILIQPVSFQDIANDVIELVGGVVTG